MTMVIHEPDGLNIRSLDDVVRLARIVVDSGLVAVKRVEEAVVILLTGRELGLSPMQSFRGIYVVNGKPVLSADLMVAVVRRSGLCRSWRVVKSTAAECTIETQREGETDIASKTWTTEDARRAGLVGKGTWAQYPAQMLRHRVASDLAREVYPDVLLGLYTADEVDTAERRPTPIVVREEPEGSRSFARFCNAIDSVPGCVAVWGEYSDLQLGLYEEGADVAEYLDGATGGYERAANRLRMLCPLTEAEIRAVLSARDGELAASLDGMDATSLDAAARWWTDRGKPENPTHAAVVWRALARKASGVDVDPVATGKATKALKAACAALTPPEPPTGTDAPAASEQVAAEGASAQSDGADWTRSSAGMRSHLAGKSAVKAVLNSVVAHGTLRGYATLAAERIQALTGWDLDTAETQISDAFAKANERRERDAEAAATVRRAA